MKKGQKKIILTAECNNKAEMLLNAANYLSRNCGAIVGKWRGNWDGAQWSEKEVFAHPEKLEEERDFIFSNFGVTF